MGFALDAALRCARVTLLRTTRPGRIEPEAPSDLPEISSAAFVARSTDRIDRAFEKPLVSAPFARSIPSSFIARGRDFIDRPVPTAGERRTEQAPCEAYFSPPSGRRG